MEDGKLKFDRTCHVLYSKSCKQQIQDKIALHYQPAQRDEVWTQVQLQYADFLKDWRTDLGGGKNFHNGAGGTYDCIALMAYYVVCKSVTSLEEIEEMNVAPYQKDKPIYYEFTKCPIAEFAQKHDLLEVMPALCNPDYTAMELIHARLIRHTTCSNGCKCDYTICGDRDIYCTEHPEYKDEQGYRRNQ